MLKILLLARNAWHVTRAHVELMSAWKRVADTYPGFPKPQGRLRWYQAVILVVLLDLVAIGVASRKARV